MYKSLQQCWYQRNIYSKSTIETTKKHREIRSKLTIKAIIILVSLLLTFEHISHFFLMLLLNKKVFLWLVLQVLLGLLMLC